MDTKYLQIFLFSFRMKEEREKKIEIKYYKVKLDIY